MTLSEIKQAITDGKKVHWSNLSYDVIKDYNNQYLIVYSGNSHAIGLTWLDGVTLNGKEQDFFIGIKQTT